jgi:hypothetical protein
MHKAKQLRLAALALAMAGATSAWAEPSYTFGGYGTLAAAHASAKDSNFRSSWRQNTGSHGTVDFGVDSRLGVQGTANFNDTFSATGQLLALRRDGKESVFAEWLYGQARINDALNVRAGRVVLPAFMLSDTRNVGYSQHWVRTPAQAYLGFPVTSVDGVQAIYRTTFGDTTFTVQPTFGRAKVQMYIDVGPFFGANRLASNDGAFNKIESLALSAERGDWTLRLGHTVTQKATFTAKNVPLPAFTIRDAFTGAGLQYDNGKLLVMSEYVIRRADNNVVNTKAYYVSAGYRFGAWTPYATHAHIKYDPASVNAAWDPSTTNSVGLRWDFYKNMALKAQFDRADQSGQEFTTMANGKHVNVTSLALDFVF